MVEENPENNYRCFIYKLFYLALPYLFLCANRMNISVFACTIKGKYFYKEKRGDQYR